MESEKCQCGEDATYKIFCKPTGETICYICEKCEEARQKEIDEFNNTPEQIQARKEWDEFRQYVRELNKKQSRGING